MQDLPVVDNSISNVMKRAGVFCHFSSFIAVVDLRVGAVAVFVVMVWRVTVTIKLALFAYDGGRESLM